MIPDVYVKVMMRIKQLGKAEEFASRAMAMARNTYFNGQSVRLDGAIRLAPR